MTITHGRREDRPNGPSGAAGAWQTCRRRTCVGCLNPVFLDVRPDEPKQV
jgi:hypothetical protein